MRTIFEMEKNAVTSETSTVTEYKFFIDGIPDFIYGRVTETLAGGERPFLWELSHAWRAKPNGHFYYPSAHEYPSFEAAYESMRAYLEGMTQHLERNESYF